jgi:glycosyltransferase involved in cell wall biosynthesis
MLHLYQDRALRAYMGLLGEDRVETHFSAERMAQETLEIYEKLLP